MAQNAGKRVVTELSKVWDQVVAKGKVQSLQVQNQINILRNSSVGDQNQPHQNQKEEKMAVGAQELVDKARDKVNSSMAAYEDFIGIKQVKEAHSRVLQAETKFVTSQEERREAQSNLAQVQNQLRMLRVEVDRTARGDDRYLELIKKEIGLVREERHLSTRFEDLEKRERELFSELSNALRFSHEKERAQNEKTKYWSILGSIVGAFLGIVGTTINSRLKQNHTKAILSQTSAQVDQIEQTVQALVQKLDNNYNKNSNNNNTPFGIEVVAKVEEAIAKLDLNRFDKLKATTNTLESIVQQLEQREDKRYIDPYISHEELEKLFEKQQLFNGTMVLSSVGLLVLATVAYRFM